MIPALRQRAAILQLERMHVLLIASRLFSRLTQEHCIATNFCYSINNIARLPRLQTPCFYAEW